MSEEAVEQVEQTEVTETQEIEERAKAQGWNPDYDGPNKRSAKEFLEYGDKVAPVQKERNEQLFGEIKKLQNDLKEFRDMHTKTLAEAREESYKRALHDLKQKQRKAVEEADTEAYDQAQRQIETLETKKPEKPAPQPQGPSPDFVAWQGENTWYGTDAELTEDADVVAEALAKRRPDLQGKPFLEEVKKKLVKMHGEEKFGIQKPQKQSDAPVETGGRKSKPSGKLAGNLSQEEVKIGKKFVNEGLFESLEQYAQALEEEMKKYGSR